MTLQLTTRLIEERREEFTPGTNFDAWAFTIARFQAMAYRKNTTRQRARRVLSDDALDRVEAKFTEMSDRATDMRDALRTCLQKLSPEQRHILDARYAHDDTVKVAAEQLNRPVKSMYKALYRIRKMLMDCVRQQEAVQA
ncbi:MAG: sigma-70 family RNA polymerase sigma factor [Phycisphaera sp.]|nr:sigma-70 family RNA polymerase sigma factor [Phycisphaera sp.]